VGSVGALTGLQLVLGEGLLTTTHPEVWRKSRRMLQPLFHQQKVLSWTDTILEAGQRCIARLKTKPHFDIAQEMLDTTAEILYQIIFSLSPREAKWYPLNVPLSLATAKRKMLKQALATLEPVIYTLIQQRKHNRGQYQDILENLLEVQDEDSGLTDKQLRDELLTLFAAGHETTSYALAWTFYLLTRHPETYQAFVDKPDSAYAVAVFKESLRLYPTIPSAPRVALGSSTLGGFEIPKGARVFVSLYLIHRHNDFWSKPAEFIPERFLPKDPDAYMPFGLGQRYCLGKHLAMLQGSLILTQFAKDIRLELLDEAVRSKVTISLFPRTGIAMRIIS
jgi:cytochrome P450